METRQLKIFCAVAENGSLVGAADKLHLTNSAMSHSIKSLEGQLGCRLFERVGKKMVLNQAGEQLLAAVQAPLAALETAAESLKHLGKWGRTRLRVGAAASLCRCLLPPVIRELKKAHRQLELHLEAGETSGLIERLQDNQLDVALAVLPEPRAALQIRPVFRDELMFVFPAGHPWVSGRPLTREDLRTQPFILEHPSSSSAQLVQTFFKSIGVVPNAVMEISDLPTIKEMVKLNLGVAILAPWVADKELAKGSLRMRPLAAKPLSRRWLLLCLAGRRLNLAEEEFFKLCRRQATSLRLDRRDVPGGTPR